MILEERRNELLIRNDDYSIESVPNLPYFRLKHMMFGGKRIVYTLPHGREISETFDDMIFNITKDGVIIQTTPSKANMVALVVFSYINSKDIEHFDFMFSNKFEESDVDIRAIRTLIKIYSPRVRMFKDGKWDGIVIDDMFLVHNDANTYLIENNIVQKFICTVARSSTKTEAMISKIMFCLNPNLDDDVFVRQLPTHILERLKRDKE